MIKWITGGDICYGYPVNTIGITIVLVVLSITFSLIGYNYGKNKK